MGTGITTIQSHSGVVTAYQGGRELQVAPDHPGYAKVQAALRSGNFDLALRQADVTAAVEDYATNPDDPTKGVKIVDGVFYYDNLPMKDAYTDKILEFCSQRKPVEFLILFFENLMQNTSRHSINQLPLFLENKNMPLTDDGCFYAWKAVNGDWRDYFSNTVDNSVGAKYGGPPRLLRRDVDDDYSKDCSHGYHIGSVEYVSGFHRHGGHIILVKVNPKDVISVPEGECTKMRCSYYEVIEEVSPESLGLSEALYTGAVPVTPIHGDSDPDDDEDENDDDYEDSWVEEEDEAEEEEIGIGELPIALALWCESHGLQKEGFANHFVDESLRAAYKDADGATFVQRLYFHAIDDDDSSLIDTLSNKENVKQLVRLVQGE
jgi:hypothetical protein